MRFIRAVAAAFAAALLRVAAAARLLHSTLMWCIQSNKHNINSSLCWECSFSLTVLCALYLSFSVALCGGLVGPLITSLGFLAHVTTATLPHAANNGCTILRYDRLLSTSLILESIQNITMDAATCATRCTIEGATSHRAVFLRLYLWDSISNGGAVAAFHSRSTQIRCKRSGAVVSHRQPINITCTI